jgi:hypothetical protein
VPTFPAVEKNIFLPRCAPQKNFFSSQGDVDAREEKKFFLFFYRR